MRSESLSIQTLANHLRRRLEGRCPIMLLSRIDDDSLVEQFNCHEADKLRWAREKQHQKYDPKKPSVITNIAER